MNTVLGRVRVALRRIARRSWVVILTSLVAATVALAVAGSPTTKYESRAVLVVPGADDSGASRAGEAAKLAFTYAELLPQDAALVGEISEAAGVSEPTVRSRLNVNNPQNTSILNVTYQGDSPAEASRAMAALVSSVTADEPAAPSVSAGTIVLVRAGEQPEKVKGPAPGPIGLVLGLCLGIVLALALERSDARVDSVDDLSELFGVPALALSEADVPALAAVLRNWVRGREGLVTVAIVPADERDARDPRALGQLFVNAAPGSGATVVVQQRDSDGRDSWLASHTEPNASVEVHFAVPSWSGTASELLFADAATTMLVVAPGTPVSAMQNLTRSLRYFGAEPSWLFLADAATSGSASDEHGTPVPAHNPA